MHSHYYAPNNDGNVNISNQYESKQLQISALKTSTTVDQSIKQSDEHF